MRKKLTNYIFTVHRILGALLSLLFLVWFLSAFVMLYHSFPRLTTAKKKMRLETLHVPLPPIDSVLSEIPLDEVVHKITLNRKVDLPIFHVQTNQKTYHLPAFKGQKLPTIDRSYILKVAHQWCAAPINRIDTLTAIDQWIPYASYKRELPIYKFSFSDTKKHQLYISSRTGEPLQFTTTQSRLWAYLGAIPHWVYFTQLRQHAQIWSGVVIGLSLLGCFMVLSGLWIALYVKRKTRKRQKKYSPYRKKWYHWHYITGLLFGVTTFTFCFSGMMSVAPIPHWISHSHRAQNPITKLNRPILQWRKMTDYRILLTRYPDLKEIEWKQLGTTKFYALRQGKKKKYYLDASTSDLNPLHLSAADVSTAIRPLHHAQDTLRITLLHHFETHYRDMSRMYREKKLLPVWKVEVDDQDKSCYYVLPNTGEVRYVDQTKRLRYWVYTALHRLRIQGLNSSPHLRKAILWILLLGGTVTSFSGIVLSVRYVRRKIKHLNKRKK